MYKKRIMFCGEASYLSTGYSTFHLEILKRFHASGKYELCELATYGDTSDPRENRWRDLPWKFIPVMPNRNKPAEIAAYKSYQLNQFGGWKFEQACLDFRPDFTVTITDPWMCSYQAKSPFRPYYHWTWMPTVDAAPMQNEWVELAMNADAVFAYSDWGLEQLKKQGGGKIKTLCSTPTGADFEAFTVKPDKRSHRHMMGVDPNIYLIGTVMRNQKRKLYPQLGEAFASLLKELPEEIAVKTYMLWHTAHPDIGWNIAQILKDNGIACKVYFTYHCTKCGLVFLSFFQDSKTSCPKCGQQAGQFPHTHHGISRKVLGDLYSLMDCYVQYSVCEGLGFPAIEAAACGVPVFETDYSAMSDVVRKLKGFPIKVKAFYKESETTRDMAIPDNDDLVKQLLDFLLIPEPIRMRMGRETRKCVEEHYNWDKIHQIWDDHFTNLEVRPHEQTWNSPLKIHKPNLNIPQGLTNDEFIRWGIINIAHAPELLNSYQAVKMVRDLNWGASLANTGSFSFNEESMLGIQPKTEPFDRKKAIEQMVAVCENRNKWEKIRTESKR